MVNFGIESLAEVMRLGKEAADSISKHFLKPIKLEFEKVYWPYLLMNRKRYAGLYWTKVDKWDKIDTKGIESVRRDNCALIRRMINDILYFILVEKDEKKAINYTQDMIS
jgi:DNA polymerase delta subunit 1